MVNGIRFSFPQSLKVKSILQIVIVAIYMDSPMSLVADCVKRAMLVNKGQIPSSLLTWIKNLDVFIDKECLLDAIRTKLLHLDAILGKQLKGWSETKFDLSALENNV